MLSALYGWDCLWSPLNTSATELLHCICNIANFDIFYIKYFVKINCSNGFYRLKYIVWEEYIFFLVVYQWFIAWYYKNTVICNSDISLEYWYSNSVTYIEISMEPIYFLPIESNLWWIFKRLVTLVALLLAFLTLFISPTGVL